MEELYKKQNRVSVSNNGDKLGINRAGVDVAMDAGMGVNNRGVNADL